MEAPQVPQEVSPRLVRLPMLILAALAAQTPLSVPGLLLQRAGIGAVPEVLALVRTAQFLLLLVVLH